MTLSIWGVSTYFKNTLPSNFFYMPSTMFWGAAHSIQNNLLSHWIEELKILGHIWPESLEFMSALSIMLYMYIRPPPSLLYSSWVMWLMLCKVLHFIVDRFKQFFVENQVTAYGLNIHQLIFHAIGCIKPPLPKQLQVRVTSSKLFHIIISSTG